MVKRCAWGECTADDRYPDKLNGSYFLPFPKPKTQLEKCLRWIRACGRPHSQLNVELINKHKFVCSRHFVGSNGPTKEFPDPLPADGSRLTPSRPSPRRRRRIVVEQLFTDSEMNSEAPAEENDHVDIPEITPGVGTQTEIPWCSPVDLLTQAAEIESLKITLKNHEESIETLKEELNLKDVFIRELTDRLRNKSQLSVTNILERKNLKGLFKFYTGLTYVRFCALLAFLMPAGFSLKYESNRQDIQEISNQDCLLLVLCRLRQNYFLKDLAMRFGLTLQSSGAVFNAWVKHMYLKLGQLSIWPHRDIIIRNMPQDYKSEFPSTLVIIDGTEIRTQTPCALGLQSQCYSDYKSSTTLKCLIGCDPNGSITFVSELFTGAISDKALSEESGFYDLLKDLIQKEYVKKGDAVMADKGFTIEKELSELGLKLNIPPHASSSCQMSAADTELTQKIAKHRIHIERLIAKVKKFRIVAHTIPTNLFQTINQIWSVACLLKLFQDVFVKDKEK